MTQVNSVNQLEITSDQERRKVFLRYVNRAWLILGIVTLASIPIFPEQRSVFIFLAAITFPTYLIIRFVNLSGKTKLAGVVFTFSVNFGFYGLFMFYVAQLGAYKAFETEATVWMLMGLAVLFAGALVDKRAAPILAAFNSILLIGTRLIIAPDSDPRPSAAVFWWMMALTVWLYEGTLHGALRRSWAEVMERKQAHKAIQETELKYRTLVERLPVVVYTAELGTNGIWHYISPQIEPLLGFTPDEWMANSGLWYRQIHPDDRGRQEELEEQAWKQRETFESEYRLLTRDGRLIWVRDSAQVLLPQNNGAPIVQGVLINITERKRTEEALRESESLLKEVQVVANMGSYVLDFSAGMWKSSAIFDKLFGIDDTYIRSIEGWSNLIHPDHRQQMIDYLTNEVMGRHLRFDREYKIIRKNDGAVRWVHGLGELEFDAQDKLLKMFGVIQDITERKQVEEALRESEELYRKMNENSPLGMHFYRLERNELIFVGANPSADKLLGTDNSQFIGETIGEAFPPLMQTEVPERYHEAAARGISWSTEQIAYEDKQIKGAFEVRAFQTTPGNMVAVFADITARKQAEDQMRQRVVELETLYESGLAINQLLDPKEIGQKAIELLEQKLGWYYTAVILYHSQDDSLELLAFNQPGLKNEVERREAEEHFKTLATRSTQGMNGWTVQHKQVIRSGSLQNDPRYVDAYPGLQSGLYVPMKLGDRVIGVISIESEQPDAFSSADERLAATLANQVASALENARLFEETEHRFMEFAALYEISNALSADNDLNTLLKDIVEHASTLLNAKTGAMYLYNQTNESLEIVVTTTPVIEIGTTLRLGEGVAGQVARTHQPMRIVDYSNWEGRSHKYDGILFHAILEVPMLFGGELIGVLNVAEMDDSSRTFTESDERLLSLFAAQAAGVLHSAHLREETARRAREFAALYETSKALSSENELNVMLEVIVEHARKLLGSASSGIYLYLTESDELELTVDTTHYKPIGTRLQLSEGVAGRVAQTHQPLRIDDYSTWKGRSPVYDGTPIRAVLEVPMLYGGDLIGVLTADEINDSERKFTEADEHLLSLFASQAAGAIHSARLREQTAHRLDQLQALHIVDRAISSSFELRPILNTLITQAIAQLNVDAVDVLLFHPNLQMLDYVAGQGFRTRTVEKTQLRLGECFAGRAALERRMVHTPNLPEAGSNFTRALILQAEGFLEYYAVPLIAKGEVKGVLEVFNRTALHSNEEWLDFLGTLAEQAAITIDQTKLFDDLQRANFELITAYDATIEGWARAMDLRDKETENHTQRVTELTLSLAKALGIKDSEILHIRRGALLHDIGKMGVPDNILLKKGKLTEDEWILMRRHPQFAYEMLQPIKYLRQSLDIPYCHHEKWDGTGYPRGLKAEQIPLAARIFAIADVWDAVTSDRSYRKAWSGKKALAYIREQNGKQFDPQVVDVFLRILGNGGS
jgi:PAS domain S-box-containing protein/putative nucleotidyltransferase with HDIG domain